MIIHRVLAQQSLSKHYVQLQGKSVSRSVHSGLATSTFQLVLVLVLGAFAEGAALHTANTRQRKLLWLPFMRHL